MSSTKYRLTTGINVANIYMGRTGRYVDGAFKIHETLPLIGLELSESGGGWRPARTLRNAAPAKLETIRVVRGVTSRKRYVLTGRTVTGLEVVTCELYGINALPYMIPREPKTR